MKPITRDEMYLAAAAGEYSGELPEPVTRLEYYLKKIKEAVENGSSVAPEDIDAAIEAYLNSHDADIVTEQELSDALAGYYNKTAIDNALDGKADVANIPDVSNFIDADVDNLTNYYDKDAVTRMLNVASTQLMPASKIVTRMTYSDNLFDISAATEGKFLVGSYGLESDNANYGYSDFIEINGSDYTYANLSNGSAIYFYDATFAVLGFGRLDEFADGDSRPTGTKYCRFNFRLSNSVEFKITIESLKKYILSSDVFPAYKNILVGQNRPLATLKAAVDEAKNLLSEYQTVNILLDEGVYNTLDGFDLSGESSSFVGLTLPDHVNIYGLGNPDNTVLTADGSDLPAHLAGASVSTLNLYRNNIIENVTIKSHDLKYDIHDDDAFTTDGAAVEDAVQIFNRVKFINYAQTNRIVTSYNVGIGAKHGQNITFKNCEFNNEDTTLCCLLIHNSVTYTKPCEFNLESCLFKGNSRYCLRLSTAGDGEMNIVNIKGCKISSIHFDKQNAYAGNNVAFKVFGYGNTVVTTTANNVNLTAETTEMLL